MKIHICINLNTGKINKGEPIYEIPDDDDNTNENGCNSSLVIPDLPINIDFNDEPEDMGMGSIGDAVSQIDAEENESVSSDNVMSPADVIPVKVKRPTGRHPIGTRELAHLGVLDRTEPVIRQAKLHAAESIAGK